MMKVRPRRFRPRFECVWRQAKSCFSLSIVLPVALSASVAVSLPWESSVPKEWWVGFKVGLGIGLLAFIVLMSLISLAKQWRQNRIEADDTSDSAVGVLEGSKSDAESARSAALHGAQWVDHAYALYLAPEYVPFWKAVDSAETYLRQCCEHLAAVHERRVSYAGLLFDRQHTFPDLDEELGILLDPRPDMQRLTDIVRNAHGNRDFAIIASHNEMTKAVEVGFSQLTSAVQQLERSVTKSLDDLRKEVVLEIQKSTSIQTKILQGVQLMATKNALDRLADRS